MHGPDLVLVERVADHAILVDFRSMCRISRGEARRRMLDRQHGSEHRHETCPTASAKAREPALAVAKSHLHDVPPWHGPGGIVVQSERSVLPFPTVPGSRHDESYSRRSACGPT